MTNFSCTNAKWPDIYFSSMQVDLYILYLSIVKDNKASYILLSE